MSRHKLVKQLDVEQELDDYDGADDYDADDGSAGLSAEDKEQLRLGTNQVRDVLGPNVHVSDAAIQESLWYYYYDIEKSVNYILGQRTTSSLKKRQKSKPEPASVVNDVPGSLDPIACMEHACPGQSVIAEFFKDAPWLNIPAGRRAKILIEPLYSPGRLLGGSPSQESGKVSKLAAFAAARRKKENANPSTSRDNHSVALLDRLKKPHTTPCTSAISSRPAAVDFQESLQQDSQQSLRRLPIRQKPPSDSTLQEKQQITEDFALHNKGPSIPSRVVTVPVASPSPFARTLFGYLPGLPQAEAGDASFCSTLQLPKRFSLYSVETKIDAFAEPSPDDVILKAQSSKGSRGTEPHNEKEMITIAKAVGTTTIHEAAKVKRKNLNVIAEFQKRKTKPTANFVVIGHVDAGKSTLMGRLLYDLKVVDKRMLDKYRREAESIGKSSFALAWVLDQEAEERSQGVTIDIGIKKFETDRTVFTILDAPGHRDFIPNMIAGASQADFAVLVIDASTGSFESGLKGQSKEHALLVRSMGVQRIIVAVNKLDTLSWSRGRYDEIQQQVSAFLTAVGFQEKNLAFLPCSGLTGDNIVRPVTDPKASWYSGPPLITLLESAEPFARALEKPLRLTIDDVFRGGVQNPVSVYGRIDAGSVQVGDIVVATPSNEKASIKGIEADSEPNDWAVAGQNVVLHLSEIDPKYLKTGDIICPPSAPIKSLSQFAMKVLAFEHILPMAVEVHKGRLHAPGRIISLDAVLDKASGKPVGGGRKKVKIIKPGSVAKVVIEVDEPVPLEVGGKVILRAEGQTVGAGLLE